MVKKVITWAAIAFVVFFVAGQPQAAAGIMRAIGNGLLDLAHGFGTFISSLVT
jgi:hypothetical protein